MATSSNTPSLGVAACRMDETYNGYANRETWAVALHINNDQGWQENVLETLRAVRDWHQHQETLHGAENVPQATKLDAHKAGEIIRENVNDWIEYLADRGTPEAARDLWGLLSDVGSLWRVSWQELGAAFLDDLADIDRAGD